MATVVLALAVAFPAAAATLRNATARPGDCAACHKADKVLPAGHPDVRGLKFDGCVPCHAPRTGGSLTGKLPGSHLHQLRGVGCTQCHGSAKKQVEVASDRCIACHDTTRLVQATAQTKPKNPHDSPHYGKDADCNLCHRQHRRSENYCAQCHKFEFAVP